MFEKSEYKDLTLKYLFLTCSKPERHDGSSNTDFGHELDNCTSQMKDSRTWLWWLIWSPTHWLAINWMILPVKLTAELSGDD